MSTIVRNFRVIRAEVTEWYHQMVLNLKRVKNITLLPGKDNFLHIYQNGVTETFRALPRTFGYAFSIWLLYKIVQPFIQ